MNEKVTEPGKIPCPVCHRNSVLTFLDLPCLPCHFHFIDFHQSGHLKLVDDVHRRSHLLLPRNNSTVVSTCRRPGSIHYILEGLQLLTFLQSITFVRRIFASSSHAPSPKAAYDLALLTILPLPAAGQYGSCPVRKSTSSLTFCRVFALASLGPFEPFEPSPAFTLTFPPVPCHHVAHEPRQKSCQQPFNLSCFEILSLLAEILS